MSRQKASFLRVILLMVCMFLLPSKMRAEKEAWVEYLDGTLTFHYDENRSKSNNADIYSLPEAGEAPGWCGKDVEHVKIDECFKDARPVRCYKWFYNLPNLTEIEGLENLCTDSVNDMSYMFAYSRSLKEIDLSHFNTSCVTTMTHMFEYCPGLTSLDVTSFNTQNVDDMSSMFDCCSSITELDLTSFDTHKVTNMRGMFLTSVRLVKITVSSRFVLDQVERSELMFYGCDNLPGLVTDSVDKTKAKDYLTYLPCYPWVEYQAETNSLRFRYDDLRRFVTSTDQYDLPAAGVDPGWLSHIDADRVTIDPSFSQARPVSLRKWFLLQSKITEIEGLENLCTDSVTEMYEVFCQCKNLKQLDLSGFNTEHVTTMKSMFYLCQGLTEVNLRSFNTENVTDMSLMFIDCRNLKELDLTSFNTKNVTTMYEMFDMVGGATSLEHIYVSEQFVADQLPQYSPMFYQCEKLPNYTYGQFDKTKAHYKEGGYLTLRRQFSVGEARYNVDGYVAPTCYTDVDFTDGAAYSAAFSFAFAPNHYATYTRKVSNHWATLCLPFAFSATDDSPSRFYGIESYTEGNITVKQLTDTVPAGMPVLAYVTGDELNVSAVGTAVVTAPATSDLLEGTFAEKELDNEAYIIANDHFWNVFWLKMENGKTNHVWIAPYRASLKLDLDIYYNAKPDSVGIAFGETDTDGVTDPSVSLRQDTDLASLLDGAELYDLQGRRLTAPQRGLMIIRKGGVSRKVVVR